VPEPVLCPGAGAAERLQEMLYLDYQKKINLTKMYLFKQHRIL
jgi:hypothetical protein